MLLNPRQHYLEKKAHRLFTSLEKPSFAQYVEHLPEAFVTHRVSVDVYPDMLQRLTFMEI